MSAWESLVEATIDAIRVDSVNKEVRIEVTCVWEGKDRKQVIATGVDDFLVHEMRLSNIVDRVSRFAADEVKGEGAGLASRLFFLMQGREPDNSDLEWPELRQRLTHIKDGVLGLLEIEPVYGATILILAKDFKLEPMV